MFNIFKKKEKPQESLCWEKPKIIDASLKLDKYANKKRIKLIKEVLNKVGMENIDFETLDGINCWVGPDTTTGYGLLIYMGTSIMDKLARLENLIKSNNKSSKSNKKSKYRNNLVKKK